MRKSATIHGSVRTAWWREERSESRAYPAVERESTRAVGTASVRLSQQVQAILAAWVVSWKRHVRCQLLRGGSAMSAPERR
eukprot:101243-Rhodomonas_salina.1